MKDNSEPIKNSTFLIILRTTCFKFREAKLKEQSRAQLILEVRLNVFPKQLCKEPAKRYVVRLHHNIKVVLFRSDKSSASSLRY